jgi:Putative metal-binding motif
MWKRSRLFVLALLASCPGAAWGRSAGVAAVGCDGCHSGGKEPTVKLSASPLTAAVGEPITLTIDVSQTNGTSAGFYLTTAFDAPGKFSAIESGTTVATSGMFQTSARTGSGGTTTFKVQWAASQPTGVAFDVYALSANGDRSNRGDGAGSARLELTVGCEGNAYYIDQDGDGFGSDDPVFRQRRECSQPLGYAPRAGDCDDFRATVFPGAPELCDMVDNDCDKEVDDAVVSQPYCEDRDGDGHGVESGTTKMDCKPTAGFGVCDDDCDDRDERLFPGAEEVCDQRDNDCDGEVDEGVLPVCGVGSCARRARGCAASDCTPGEPLPEACNGFDDDCDGVADNGDDAALCGAGKRCVAGACTGDGGGGSSSGAPSAPGAGGGPSGGVSAGAGGAGGSVSGTDSEGGCAVAPPGSPSRAAVFLSAALGALVARRRRAAASGHCAKKTGSGPPA